MDPAPPWAGRGSWLSGGGWGTAGLDVCVVGPSAESRSLSDTGGPISQSRRRSGAPWVGPRAVGGLQDVKDWRRRLFKQCLIINWLETSAVWILIIAGVKLLPVGGGDS